MEQIKPYILIIFFIKFIYIKATNMIVFPINHTLKNNLELVIARASPEMADEIINFLNEVAGETDNLTFGKSEFPFSLNDEIAMINEYLEKEISLMLIGKIEKKIVAHLFLEGSEKERLKHIANLGISVSMHYWGNQIGLKMMEAALAWAKEKQIRKIALQVSVDNERAIGLYQKLGFEIEGRIKDALKIGDHYKDDYLMSLIRR